MATMIPFIPLPDLDAFVPVSPLYNTPNKPRVLATPRKRKSPITLQPMRQLLIEYEHKERPRWIEEDAIQSTIVHEQQLGCNKFAHAELLSGPDAFKCVVKYEQHDTQNALRIVHNRMSSMQRLCTAAKSYSWPEHIVRLDYVWKEVDKQRQMWLNVQMEYCNGHSVAHWFPKQTANHEMHLWRLIHHVSLGLQSLHNANLLHMDLKPFNILVCTDEQGTEIVFKLADFGNCYDLTSKDADPLDGDPAYLDPRVLNERPDALVDIYALGQTVYALITRRAAIKVVASHATAAIDRVACLTDLASAAIQVSATLQALVLRMLDQDASKRPTVDELCIIARQKLCVDE